MTWIKPPWSAGLGGRWVLIDQVNQDNLVEPWNDLVVIGGMALLFVVSWRNELLYHGSRHLHFPFDTNDQISGSRGPFSVERVPSEADQCQLCQLLEE